MSVTKLFIGWSGLNGKGVCYMWFRAGQVPRNSFISKHVVLEQNLER